jgi:hypothetical protein
MVEAGDGSQRVVLDFFERLNAADLEGVRAILTEDATWTPQVKDIPGAGVYRGRNVIVDEFLAPIRGLFADGDPKNRILSIASNGPLVLIETEGTGHVRDGRPYENRYAWAFEVRDGKVAAIREYMDSHYVARLFGLG